MATRDPFPSKDSPESGPIHEPLRPRMDPTRTRDDVVTRGAPDRAGAIGKRSDTRERQPIPAETNDLDTSGVESASPKMRGAPNLKNESGNLDRTKEKE